VEHQHVVLLVEDHADTCDAISTLLESEGYFTVCAADGEEALAVLQGGVRPCIILLDMMMPRMSGEDFREIQRANPAWRDIPVALYTGDGAAEAKAQRLGVDYWFAKPLDVEQLLGVVEESWDGTRQARPG
jgi:CheY-like chemotaxis protein